MSTAFYDNPEWEGEPIANRHFKGGKTVIQAYFEEGDMDQATFYGDDGSIAYGVEQLIELADDFHYDSFESALDRSLELATLRADISKRGPEWAKAVGLPESISVDVYASIIEDIVLNETNITFPVKSWDVKRNGYISEGSTDVNGILKLMGLSKVSDEVLDFIQATQKVDGFLFFKTTMGTFEGGFASVYNRCQWIADRGYTAAILFYGLSGPEDLKVYTNLPSSIVNLHIEYHTLDNTTLYLDQWLGDTFVTEAVDTFLQKCPPSEGVVEVEDKSPLYKHWPKTRRLIYHPSEGGRKTSLSVKKGVTHYIQF